MKDNRRRWGRRSLVLMALLVAFAVACGDAGKTPIGASNNGSVSNGATTNSATTNSATTNSATTNSATTNSATTNSATTNSATTNMALCEVDEHVQGGACVACPTGTFNAEGDDPAAGDTECALLLCLQDERVEANTCVACPAGTVSDEGADASGADTQCEAVLCGEDEYVVANACAACPAGTSNLAGDDASEADTMCDAGMCPSNEYVEANACVPCPAGTTNPAGDDQSGADTSCEPELCEIDQNVSSNTCVRCPAGSTNDAGDDASGEDTRCDATLCMRGERVENHVCVACPPDSTNGAGDNATGPDTTCDDACTAALGLPCSEFEQAYLKASNTSANDYFGVDVAIDGDTLAVSAFGRDAGASGGGGINVLAQNSGAVYVFTRSGTTWTQQAYLTASNPGAEDHFGLNIALDGDTLAVGSPQEDSDSTGVNQDELNNDALNSGAVYVFTRSGTTWSQEAYLKASNTDTYDWFGSDVALDGDTLAVGARGEDSNATGVNNNQADNSLSNVGAAYIFTRSGTTWSQQAYLKPSTVNGNESFGTSITIDGDTVAVGASMEKSDATTINGDETPNPMMIGVGAVYVFTRSGTAWSQQAYIKASNAGHVDYFGSALSLSGDTLAVGAWGEDSSATGVNGDQTNDNLPNSGAVYVFTRFGTTWSQQAYLKASLPDLSDHFGAAVSLDGDRLLVGAWGEDSNATGVNGDLFNQDFGESGAVYLFARSGTIWSQQAYIKASNTGADDVFGSSVAVDGNTIVAGAQREDSNATGVNGDETNDDSQGSGAAYVRIIAP